jgi:hypothetical protein
MPATAAFTLSKGGVSMPCARISIQKQRRFEQLRQLPSTAQTTHCFNRTSGTEVPPFYCDKISFSSACKPRLLCPIFLEQQLRAELEDTRILCARHLPEVAVVRSSIDLIELGMVERIERFGAELQANRFMDREILE